MDKVLLEVMSAYQKVGELEKQLKSLLNEVQLLITTKATADEIIIEEED